IGRRVRHCATTAADHVAAQIDQGCGDPHLGEVDADRESTFRVQPKKGWRQATALGILPEGNEVVLLFQLSHDRRYGLYRKTYTRCYFTSSGRAVEANGLQDDSPVIRSTKLLVRAPERHRVALSMEEGCIDQLFSQMDFRN